MSAPPALPPAVKGAFERLRATIAVAWNHKEGLAAVDRAEREVAFAIGELPPEGVPLEPARNELWG